MDRIVLITGVSSGLGRAFAEAALANGDIVVGTVRRDTDRAGFEALAPGRAKAIVLDVTTFAAIDPAVAAITRDIGPIDVLVNNAGYGHEGPLEESSLDDMRRQFDVNVFGAVAMTKAVLPGMRDRRKGHIVNVTSMGGFITMPGISFYCGSKFALEGISEVLAKEVAGFGIKVTALAPGGFRTDWAGRSMVRAERAIADYDDMFDPIRAGRKARDGNQPGDPAKAGLAFLALIDSENPPVHLLLGNDALALVRGKLEAMAADIAKWEALSRSTDFDAAQAPAARRA